MEQQITAFAELHLLLSLEWTYANHLHLNARMAPKFAPYTRAEWARKWLDAVRA